MGVLSMTRHESETFLAGLHVGVLAVSRAEGGAPIVAPIWYSYEPGGEIVMTTDSASVKVKALRTVGVASLCAQTEDAPYRYIVVEGPVRVVDGVDPSWRRSLAHRYLGAELGDVYTDLTADSEASAVTIRLTPRRWRTLDYTKQFA